MEKAQEAFLLQFEIQLVMTPGIGQPCLPFSGFILKRQKAQEPHPQAINRLLCY